MDSISWQFAIPALFAVFVIYFLHGRLLYWRVRAETLTGERDKLTERLKIKPGWTVVQLKIGDTVYHEGALYIVTDDGYTVLYEPDIEGA